MAREWAVMNGWLATASVPEILRELHAEQHRRQFPRPAYVQRYQQRLRKLLGQSELTKLAQELKPTHD